MDYQIELESKSIPRIKKAASAIKKGVIKGYGESLLVALETALEKPKSWKAQSEIIRALGVTDCIESLEFLEELKDRSFDATTLYIDLGFSICLLRDLPNNQLSFLKSIRDTENTLLLSGVCSAILFKEFIPSDEDIKLILNSIVHIDDSEGQILTPRCYIACVAYLWPLSLTKEFLQDCENSKWSGLVEIAQSSLSGKKSKNVLV